MVVATSPTVFSSISARPVVSGDTLISTKKEVPASEVVMVKVHGEDRVSRGKGRALAGRQVPQGVGQDPGATRATIQGTGPVVEVAAGEHREVALGAATADGRCSSAFRLRTHTRPRRHYCRRSYFRSPFVFLLDTFSAAPCEMSVTSSRPPL